MVDIAYSKANLEHAAASVTNLIQATLLVALLAIPLVAMSSTDISVFGIHPATLLIPITYIFGLYLISESQSLPMWRPLQTSNTMQETVPHAELERVGEDSGLRSLAVPVSRFSRSGDGGGLRGSPLRFRTFPSSTPLGGFSREFIYRHL
uniref:Uncharacterized protein n=1 Tax=Desertifilum tharense IPPAS B-1220 TaxID=1781255 RepID=A0ACD5GNZ2_9CYAN